MSFDGCGMFPSSMRAAPRSGGGNRSKNDPQSSIIDSREVRGPENLLPGFRKRVAETVGKKGFYLLVTYPRKLSMRLVLALYY